MGTWRTTVAVTAGSSHQYYGFYLSGIERVLGRVRFVPSASVAPAPAQSTSGLGFVVHGRRIWIGAGDNNLIEHEPLAWADVYGVVNATAEQVATSPKLVPIGPSFGIRWRSLPHTIAYVTRAAAAERSGPRALAARLVSSTGYHRSRRPLEAYDRPASSESGVAFYAGTMWDHHRWSPSARVHFIEAARTSSVAFEGGVVPDGNLADQIDPQLLAPRRYTLDEYLDRVRRSAVAFNSPAVWGCLGWKLGESLALGKAILTTAIGRELPAPLRHGIEVHVVADDPDAMRDALELIAGDDDYRSHLEAGARAYWERWLRPERVIERLLEAAR